MLQLQVHGKGSWLPPQSAETQPQEQRRIVSVVAKDWFYLKNLSLSRMHSLNTIFQWIAPDAFLPPRIQEPSLWIFVYSENNTLKDSVQRWEYLEALQHKNRCWFSFNSYSTLKAPNSQLILLRANTELFAMWCKARLGYPRGTTSRMSFEWLTPIKKRLLIRVFVLGFFFKQVHRSTPTQHS